MVAIIETGSKQYKVSPGTIIDIEKLPLEIGDTVRFDKVLLLEDEKNFKVGQPYLEGVVVEATVLNQIKAPKVIVFKFKRKTGYKRTQGHRQRYTTVKVTGIQVNVPAPEKIVKA